MYNAKVIRATNIIPHPNADKIQLLIYNGLTFVIGKDIVQDQLVVMFPADGQLSAEFCKYNNLNRDPKLNADPTKTGFFEESRRVRAQPFRGQKSDGFVCDLSAFYYAQSEKKIHEFLVEGVEFDTINGHVICEKYVTQATRNAIASRSGKKGKRVEYVDYALIKHYDTAQLAYNLERIREMENYLVITTEKLHGTSGRTGLVLVTREKYSKFALLVNGIFKRRVIKPTVTKKYEYVTGSRNMIVDTANMDNSSKEYYRTVCHERVSKLLVKGETVYYEIVGYSNTGSPFMGTHSTEKLGKDAVARFGKSITYSYGCLKEPDNMLFDIYVYRITMQNEDGFVTEYDWFQVEKRCKELGLKTVPVLRYDFIVVKGIDFVENIAEFFTKDCPVSVLDSRHIREGVVVRIESNQGIQCFKKKTYEFLLMEGIAKDNSNYVDTEEAA